MELAWQLNAWQDYLYWQETDKAKQKKLNALIREVLRTPFTGSGKPEALKGKYSGLWSRRITGEHRLVYAVQSSKITICQCRFHNDN